jgi:predicted nucleic acid-binding protein
MEAFGSLKVRRERDGRRLDDFDLVIAATAITIGYRLVTNNEHHFSRDRRLGNQPLGSIHPLAELHRFRRVLRFHGR